MKNHVIKKNNKAQISIFVILAIALIAVIIIFFLVNNNPILTKINQEIQPIHSFIQSCISQSAENSIYHIGETGGYFELPELKTDNNIAYHYIDETNQLPSKQKIVEELNLYFNNDLFFCTKNFIDFSDYEITQKPIITNIQINDNNIIFNINYPLSIKKETKTYTLENFETTIDVRLGIIYNVLNEMMTLQLEKKDDLCITCLGELAEDNDLYIHLRDYNEETTIFYIIDRNSIINGDEYVFNFANRYESDEI